MSLGFDPVEIPGSLSKSNFEDRMRAKAKLMAEPMEARSIDKDKETGDMREKQSKKGSHTEVFNIQ